MNPPEAGRRHTCLLIADFNPANLAARMRHDPAEPQVRVVEAPMGQVVPALCGGAGSGWEEDPDCCLVWARPEAVSPAFARLAGGEPVAAARILAEVDAFAAGLGEAASRVRALFVASFAVPVHQRGYGVIDLSWPGGVGRALLQMNLRLAEAAASSGNVWVLDAGRWMAAAGRGAFSPKLWHMARVPFAPAVFDEAVAEVKAGLDALDGRARKVVVVDLDDTLWGGIVGEVGWEGLRLGGHDRIGEAHQEFQRALKALARRGVLLTVASRNDEAVALEAMERHPEMVLRPADLAGWRIGWGDKALGIADLMGELNVGLEAAVFIDDSPFERERVRAALPQVLVPPWPADPALFAPALLGLRCFDVLQVSAEDRARPEAYASERQRRQLRQEVPSLSAWLASLGVQVRAEPLTPATAGRAAQLAGRTNQMTLGVRRPTQMELLAQGERPGTEVWIYGVSDRFGDSGLTGLATLQVDGGDARLADFAISCRVLGRGVEETVTHHLVGRACALGAARLVATPAATQRNRPCREFLARALGAAVDGTHAWPVAGGFPLPAHVELRACPP
ncbi:MAG: HAD-IIIC family phosphatase [Candidatus Latescibacterota bacterium]